MDEAQPPLELAELRRQLGELRLVEVAMGEAAIELALGGEDLAPDPRRFRSHLLEARRDLRPLPGRQGQLVREVENMLRSGVPVELGGHRVAEARALREPLLPLG